MSTAALNDRFAATLAHGLAAAGLRHAVVCPGSRNTPLVLALAAVEEITTHVVLDERAAGFVALGIGRASAAPAAVVVTSGTAGAHLLPAVIEARQGRVPLLVLTADRPPELHHSGAPQTVPQARLFGEHIRWCADLGAPDGEFSSRWLCATAAKALAHARGGPAGPVHINLPFREPLWSADTPTSPVTSTAPQVMRGRACLDSQTLSGLAARLGAARRGVIVCGPRAPATLPGREFATSVANLAAALGWPVLAEPCSGLRYGPHERSPIIAAYDALLRAESFATAHEPDLVLRFGQAPTSKALSAWISAHAADRTLLIDPDGQWHDPDHSASALVVADPIDLCDALASAVTSSADPAWLSSWRSAEVAAAGVLEDACGEGCWEGAIAKTVVATLPEGALLHVASSMPVRDLDGFTGVTGRHIAVQANRGANGIDGMLATGVGAAVAHEGPAVVLTGDLAFLHDLGGLIASVATRLTIVVINNGGGGIFEFLPIAHHPDCFERFFVTPQSADIGALVRAAGARHVRVETTEALAAALATELERPQVGVIEVSVDRTENVARHDAAWQAVADALNQKEKSPCR